VGEVGDRPGERAAPQRAGAAREADLASDRADPVRRPDSAADGAAETRGSPGRLRPRSGGVSLIAGGLLQDLEDRLRRDLAPIEERVRPGEEARYLGGGAGGILGADPLVIVLPDRT